MEAFNWIQNHWLEIVAIAGWLYSGMSEYMGANPNMKHNAVFQFIFALLGGIAKKKGGEESGKEG